MIISVKKILLSYFMLSGSIACAAVCNVVPGSITCSGGTVDNLSGNGMVTVQGTVIAGSSVINGLLNAEDSRFQSLEVNGSARLDQCTINDFSSFKGSLTASSTRFEKSMEIYSDEVHFVNSKVLHDLHFRHTIAGIQTVYLDNFSEVSGNIIFDDEKGEVIVRGKSKIGGKVIGGNTTVK